MTDKQGERIFFAAFHESRLWVTLLWALAVAGGLAVMDGAEQHFRAQAANQPLMLLSERPGDEIRRGDLKREIITHAGIAGARWRTPEELIGSVSGHFPQEQWGDLFPDDVAWLPWMLEVYPADPLANMKAMRALVARCRKQPETWSVVLWDSETVGRLARQRRDVRLTLGFWILLVGLAGAAGLMRQKGPERGGVGLIVWSGLLGVFSPVGVWVVHWLSSGTADIRALFIGSVTGLVLSVLIAPQLRVRRRQAVSLVISEENDEREDSDQHH